MVSCIDDSYFVLLSCEFSMDSQRACHGPYCGGVLGGITTETEVREPEINAKLNRWQRLRGMRDKGS